MQVLRITLEDDVFWRLYEAAVRERRKATEHAALLIERALEEREAPVEAA